MSGSGFVIRAVQEKGTLDFGLGCFAGGILTSFLLFGVIFAQTVSYFENYWTDALAIRLCVAALAFLAVFQTAVQANWFHNVFISGFGDLMGLLQTPWTLESNFVFLAIVSSIVQVYFAARLYQLLNHNWVLPALIALASLLTCVAGFGHCIQQTMYGSYMDPRAASLNWISQSAQILPGIADLFITAGMLYSYTKTKKSTNAKGAVLIYRRIITLVIRSNALTASFALTAGILCISGWGLVAWPLTLCTPKIYIITFLSCLNARKKQRSKLHQFSMSNTVSYSVDGTTNRTADFPKNGIRAIAPFTSIDAAANMEEEDKWAAGESDKVHFSAA